MKELLHQRSTFFFQNSGNNLDAMIQKICIADAKPARHRKGFKPEGGKKAFKEKLGGQIFGNVNDEDDLGGEPEIDNFATGVEGEEE